MAKATVMSFRVTEEEADEINSILGTRNHGSPGTRHMNQRSRCTMNVSTAMSTEVKDLEFEERAAIMQYEGGLDRWAAERRALELLKEQPDLF